MGKFRPTWTTAVTESMSIILKLSETYAKAQAAAWAAESMRRRQRGGGALENRGHGPQVTVRQAVGCGRRRLDPFRVPRPHRRLLDNDDRAARAAVHSIAQGGVSLGGALLGRGA